MKDWFIEENEFDPERVTLNGNKFLIGNGYLGIRGTLEEYQKDKCPAINLAGIYDQVGDGWREPLNAPNGLYTYIKFNDDEYRIPEVLPKNYKISLDYRHGIFHRTTTWNTPAGAITINSERFASMAQKHLIAMKFSVSAECEGDVRIITGIDGDVWDINGPHYDEILVAQDQDILQAEAVTHENKDNVYVCEAYQGSIPYMQEIKPEERKIVRDILFHAKAGETYTFYKWVAIYTSKDAKDGIKEACDLIGKAQADGYDLTKNKSMKEWESKWTISEVVIEGDDAGMEALNYSIYHLHCIAPRHTDSLSIAARGLSGQTYKGAVFWDTEMFMLDFFLFTEPEVAKTLLRYRIDTLEGAKKKALQYGYQGAFYAWESQEGGYDACSDYNVTDVFTGRKLRTYFKDKQIHISAAIVYGIMRYADFTSNYELIEEGGAEVILECARFYYDLLVKKVHSDRYELHDVIGPDEYHERVNNNAYTNRMAKYTFDSAIKVIKQYSEFDLHVQERIKETYDLRLLQELFQDASDHLYIPGSDRETGIIEQFDGYKELDDISIDDLKKRLLHEKEYWGGANGIAAHTKVIKQADVVTMINLFSEDYHDDILKKNWEYYEPRTEHGSSLSACMYAILACKCAMPDIAYPLFIKSATADLSGKGKEWAGLIYIGGTHPAAAGGAYMTAIEGFAGLHQEDGELRVNPRLPSHWKRVQFNIIYRGQLHHIDITRDRVGIMKEKTSAK